MQNGTAQVNILEEAGDLLRQSTEPGNQTLSGKVVILEGLIAAGKSTFSEELAEILGPETLLLLEPDEKEGKNPYLNWYYEDPGKWAFPMQIHLLATRFRMHLRAQWRAMNTEYFSVMDRSFYGDTSFARLQLAFGHLTPQEFETYRQIYHSMTAFVLLPQFCIWLKTSPESSARRINKRIEDREGRSCESKIDLGYLHKLDQEIANMISVLKSQGVQILEVDWEKERTKEERLPHLLKVAEKIRTFQPPDLFLDLHRRTL